MSNTAKTGSGGVFSANDGTFAMSGGAIRENRLGSSLEDIASNVNVPPSGTISDANIYGYGHVYTVTLDAAGYNANTGFHPGSSLQFTPTITCLGPSYSGDIAWSTYWVTGQATTATDDEVTVTSNGLVTLAGTVPPGTLRVRVNVADSKSARMDVAVK